MEKDKNVMHIASFVLSIISLITTLFWYITLSTGILAIVFGVKSAKRYGSKLGKAGLIIGIIALSLFVFNYMCMIFMLLSNM